MEVKNDKIVFKISIYCINHIPAVLCNTHDSNREHPSPPSHGLSAVSSKSHNKADPVIAHFTL